MGSAAGFTISLDEDPDFTEMVCQTDSDNLPDETTCDNSFPGEGGDLEATGGAPSSMWHESGGLRPEGDGMALSEIPSQAPSARSEASTTSFMITLEFPGQLQPRQRYRVSPTLPVRRFYHLIADGILGCPDSQIRMYVDDECLMHLGTVTDRHFPGDPTQRTVYLFRDCVVQVRRIGSEPAGDPSPSEVAQIPGDESQDDVSSAPLRRASTRVSSKRDHASSDPSPTPHRAVRDRYFYEPVPILSSLVSIEEKEDAVQGSSGVDDGGLIPPPKRTRSLFDMERDGMFDDPPSFSTPATETDGMFDDPPSFSTPATETDTISLMSRRERAILRSSSKEADPVLQVSRRERATLLKEFKRCQRLARRQYRGSLRALWYAEIADDKDNGLDTVGDLILKTRQKLWKIIFSIR